MEATLINTLSSLGLNEKEALIYLALLKLGTASAYAISEISGTKKPTTYVILDELAKRGVVYKLPRTGKKMYRVVPPETLIKDAENKIAEARQALPSLKAITGSRKEEIKVLHFEGVSAFKEALFYRSKDSMGKEIVGFYSEAEDISQKILDICDEYNTFISKNDTATRAFVPDHPSLTRYRENDAQFKRTVEILPHSIYSSTASIDTFSNIVRIFLNKNNQAVIIENSELAKTIREIFEIMWKAREKK